MDSALCGTANLAYKIKGAANIVSCRLPLHFSHSALYSVRLREPHEEGAKKASFQEGDDDEA